VGWGVGLVWHRCGAGVGLVWYRRGTDVAQAWDWCGTGVGLVTGCEHGGGHEEEVGGLTDCLSRWLVALLTVCHVVVSCCECESVCVCV
jgi:hypothetical protein